MAHNCENCKFRAHYDKKPNSMLGRFWRWHINFCPGWKGYFTSRTPRKKPPCARNTTSPSIDHIKKNNDNEKNSSYRYFSNYRTWS